MHSEDLSIYVFPWINQFKYESYLKYAKLLFNNLQSLTFEKIKLIKLINYLMLLYFYIIRNVI